ncbi:pyridoxal phosphate-dependent aminotransferase [Psychrobacillus glaciei]|uniref:cysteine-S-conjugate beta-lyase n=1 Tax=Psychrobacillus glaciei TaxID=2283160 RepID=A0A5J6SPA8_9BACI|nr:MalY/PatB family protein [Psychrobacillus glaciei]QFF99798.1 pyridoxal phosphate-dependent aminotransferase [Psychrobacillus glaciei]
MSDFTTVYQRRNTHSVKWDSVEEIYSIPDASQVLPMWIADMDFAIPSPIIDALHQRLEHPVFGYSLAPEETKAALTNWLLKKHQLKIENKWILFQQGVIPSIAAVVEAFTEVGDKILIHTPVYPPFTSIPEKLGRVVETCRLVEKDGSLEIDFDAFEAKLKSGVKAFILCSPHNPGGKVWSKEDLTKIATLCQSNNVLVLSDEIHSDLIFKPNKHIPILSVAENPNNVISFFAPTKTFNLAGIQAATIIVPDEQKRKVLEEQALARGQMELSIFSLTAFQAAYEHGEAWLEELLEIVSSNMDFVVDQLTSKIDGIKVNKPDATYLLWIDYRDTGLSEKEMMDLLLSKGKLALEPGTKYGEAGNGFLRMNVACPRLTIEEGVARFIKALT